MEDLQKKIPETMDVIVLGLASAQVLKKHFLDGVQADDFLKIVMEYFNNDEFQGKFKEAIEGCYKIPAEIVGVVKSFDFAILLDLVRFLFSEIKKLLA